MPEIRPWILNTDSSIPQILKIENMFASQTTPKDPLPSLGGIEEIRVQEFMGLRLTRRI